MKKIILISIMILFSIQVLAKKAAELPDLIRPVRIAIDGDSLYIIEATNEVSVFSLKNHKLIRRIGKKGEGPGEFRRTPYLKILPDSLFLGTFEKFALFSKQGELLDEKKQYVLAKLLPVSGNFVRLGTKFEGEDRFRTIDLLDPNQKKLVELDSQIILDARKRGTISAIRDYLDMDTYEDKIFVTNTEKGLWITVFNTEGKELYHIEKTRKAIPISKEYKDEFLTQITQHSRQGAEWRAALERWKIEYPKFFPAMRSFSVSEGRIFIQTHKKKGDDVEFLILDLKGNILREGFFPLHEEGSLVDRYPYAFTPTAYYYLKFNLDKNVWELHEIKY